MDVSKEFGGNHAKYEQLQIVLNNWRFEGKDQITTWCRQKINLNSFFTHDSHEKTTRSRLDLRRDAIKNARRKPHNGQLL